MPRHKAPEIRFWNRVDKLGPIHPVLKTRCWIWFGGKYANGYGFFKPSCKIAIRAHRYSWIFHHGPIVDDLLVCHACDNPSCVNPSHLFLGTHSDNKIDSCKKGRHTGNPGEQNGRAIFTNEQVLEIRKRYQPRHKKNGARAIARELNVHPMTIYYIISGQSYRDAV